MIPFQRSLRLFPTPAAAVGDVALSSERWVSRAASVRTACLLVAALGTALGLRGQSVYATPYTFTTLAGRADAEGNTNATGTSARFAQPKGLAVDANGNLYVADTANHMVRKITSAGVVTTFADAASVAAAPNLSVRQLGFFYPVGVAVDGAGNVYVADNGYQAIWMVSGSGAVTQVAGGGMGPGNAPQDGVGTLASFAAATAIAADSSGNLYVADGYTIRKIALDSGRVITFVGDARLFGNADGTGGAARFSGVSGLAVDAGGTLYATDTGGNFTVRRITAAGVVTTLAGTAGTIGSADGTGPAAQFTALNGIAADSNGNLYVTVANNTVRKITSTGVVTTLAGTPGSTGSVDGTGPQALFASPFGIAVDAGGDVFVSEYFSHTIRERYAAANASPTITVQPASQSVAIGGSATFSVQASGVPTPAYQWQFNGTNVGGATNPSLTVAGVQATDLGTYSVVVSNSAGGVASSPCTLSSPGVAPVVLGVQARLANISSRAYVGAGANVAIAGFVIVGPPGSTERVLVRGIGPSLAQFGVSGMLADPVLTLFNGAGTQIGIDDLTWSGNPNFAQIISAEPTTGAFALDYASTDAALLVDLAPGAYTAEVSATSRISGAANAPGVALAEIYEVSSTGAQIINISTRAYVGTGSNVTIAGIVITGTKPANVLIRAVGPALAQFGLSGFLAHPSLSVADSSGNTIATNTGWSSGANAAALAAAAVGAGAFALPSGSADCALLLTLQPGSYTAIVSGVGGTSGVALVEAYQTPAVVAQ
jgi:sugar lactone lactonase YvrE